MSSSRQSSAMNSARSSATKSSVPNSARSSRSSLNSARSTASSTYYSIQSPVVQVPKLSISRDRNNESRQSSVLPVGGSLDVDNGYKGGVKTLQDKHAAGKKRHASPQSNIFGPPVEKEKSVAKGSRGMTLHTDPFDGSRRDKEKIRRVIHHEQPKEKKLAIRTFQAKDANTAANEGSKDSGFVSANGLTFKGGKVQGSQPKNQSRVFSSQSPANVSPVREVSKSVRFGNNKNLLQGSSATPFDFAGKDMVNHVKKHKRVMEKGASLVGVLSSIPRHAPPHAVQPPWHTCTPRPVHNDSHAVKRLSEAPFHTH